jgi:hypothetical protein
MAKQRKVLPARKPRDRSRDDDSLLLRSAESLGRVIGALQRQLDSATKRLSASSGNASKRMPPLTGGKAKRVSRTRIAKTSTRRSSTAGRKKSATRQRRAGKTRPR